MEDNKMKKIMLLLFLVLLPIATAEVNVRRIISPLQIRTGFDIPTEQQYSKISLVINVKGEEPYLIIKEQVPKGLDVIYKDAELDSIQEGYLSALILNPEDTAIEYLVKDSYLSSRRLRFFGEFSYGSDYLNWHEYKGNEHLYVVYYKCQTDADLNSDRVISKSELNKYYRLYRNKKITYQKYRQARDYYFAGSGC